MKIKVSTSNFYVGNRQPTKDAHFLANLGCDLSGVQEGHSGNAVAIRNAIHWHHTVFWGHSKNADVAKSFMDVPVVVDKRKVKPIKFWTRRLCGRSETKDIGMPRSATMARVSKGGYNITLINTHLNAAVQSRKTKAHLSTRIRRVLYYTKSIVILESIIHYARLRGDLIVLTGDLNYRTKSGGIWWFSPQALFKRCGMSYRNDGLDYIAYSSKFKPSHFNKISQTRTGADHPWLTLELTTP